MRRLIRLPLISYRLKIERWRLLAKRSLTPANNIANNREPPRARESNRAGGPPTQPGGLSWSDGGRGRLEDTKRPLIAQYSGGTIAICATCATLDLFRSAAMKLVC